MITEILSFLQIFSVKNNDSVFVNFQKSTRKSTTKNYIPGIIWVFKSKLQIILAPTSIALFLTDTNNSFLYVQYYISISVSTFFSFCVFIFLISSRHKTHSTIYYVSYNFIANCPLHYGDKNYFMVQDERKSVNDLIFSWYKVWVFPLSLLNRLTFFLVFAQNTD